MGAGRLSSTRLGFHGQACHFYQTKLQRNCRLASLQGHLEMKRQMGGGGFWGQCGGGDARSIPHL